MDKAYASGEVLATGADDRSAVLVPAGSSSKNTASSDGYWTGRRERLELLRIECGSDAEFETKKLQEHWTELVGEECIDDLDLHVANQQYFQSLVREDAARKTLERVSEFAYKPCFFVDYGDDLVVGKKIDEGGQAEIFEATIRGNKKLVGDYVVKVFKPGFAIRSLESQLTVRAHNGDYHQSNFFVECCFVESGTLLRNGSFAFVMVKYWGDLRKLIDHNMRHNSSPFPRSEALHIMRSIARGMRYLHEQGILHKDMKASNVLVNVSKERGGLLLPYECHIADFETSRGVKGTGFWRAPEVLQALQNRGKDRNAEKNIWTEKADVYSYAMTCYEILTGRIPFGNLVGTRADHDAVIRGERPLLPDDLSSEMPEFLAKCWHSDPSKRPSFNEIWHELGGATGTGITETGAGKYTVLYNLVYYFIIYLFLPETTNIIYFIILLFYVLSRIRSAA